LDVRTVLRRSRWSLPFQSLVALAALSLAPNARAQAPQPAAQRAESPRPWVHESWTTKDGLPVNSVNAIVQDRAGYIWVATFDGLVRFDGLKFTVFNTANSENLPSNRIVGLKVGGDGSLWMSTEESHIVRFRDGHFTNLQFENGKPGAGLPRLVVDTTGGVWVGTPEGLWTVNDDRLVRVARGSLDASVTAIVRRRDGSVWVGTERAGLFRVATDGAVTKVATNPTIESTYISELVEDPSGALWIGTIDGLWSLGDRLVRIKSRVPMQKIGGFAYASATGELYVTSPAGAFRINGDSATLIRPGSSDEGMRVWTDGEAVWTIGFQQMYRNGRRVLTLPEHRIGTAYLFDREGSLWLGTDSDGLHRLKQALFTTYSVDEGLSSSNVYATYVDHAGDVWIGTWGKGASRLDPAAGRAVRVAGKQAMAVNSFYEDARGTIWVGTSNSDGGILRCLRPALLCEPAAPHELGNRPVFALYGNGGNDFWAGTTGLVLHYDGTHWTTFPTAFNNREAAVRAFAKTRDGSLWMGTNGVGLLRYRDGKFTQITRANGLPSESIRSLYEDADGSLWIGTEGRGLARLDPRAWADSTSKSLAARRIVRIGTKDGLFDEVIHQILEDDNGRLWMNTNRGVFWVSRRELVAFADGKVSQVHSTAYTERDGLRNREGNGGVQPAGAKGRDGRLWFPTQDGVAVVDPRDVRRDVVAPRLVVEQVVAGGGAVRPQRDSIALQPNQRSLQVEYTALTFLEPTNVRFRYRLDPYDTAWVDVGNRRTAFYTKVPPGRYTFVVEASDAAGGWYEPGTRLAVRVLPQITETSAFRWGLLGAAGFLLFFGIRIRDARLRSRALHLEVVVAERTAALRDREHQLADRNAKLQSLDQAKTRFFSNVSHELRTPLTLTIGPLEDLRSRSSNDAQAERWLDMALRNSRRLLRLVNQLLDVAKLEAGAMHLTPRSLDLAKFTRGLVGAFAAVAERKGVRLATTAPESLRGLFDADAIEKILTNLLSNAIKFTPNGGVVDVAVSNVGASVKIVVKDTGPGIPGEHLDRVFERFYQVDESPSRSQPGTGIGLSLVRELVELHGGTITVESTSAGTAFTTVIPFAASNGDTPVTDIPDVPSLATAVTEEQSISGGEADDGERENVPTMLVVDDSADLRGYVRDHFAAKFHVLEAADGVAGIELAREHLPDIVLSDVMMPRADGFELVRSLRQSSETEFLSIVLLTAQADDQRRLEGLEHGADDYIVKPFEMRELELRIRNLIESRRRLRERFSIGRATPPVAASNLSRADQEYVRRVRDAIQDHLADPEFGVSALASALAQDRSRLFRRVKELFDQSPSDLMRRMRIDAAEPLLAESSATVSEVAYAVGFNSVSYFCRCFQDVYGHTPAAYRERLAER
jgi:signal transduction histidine kinase/ligand-binding sensor domain-containing protein/DNA-binding response OmpR family regulator